MFTINSRAFSRPASRNRAAIRASSAFTRSAFLARPPLFSSPLPRCRYLPISNCRAGRIKARALTMCARSFDKSPSAYSGNRLNNSWLTTNARIASPRNSNCSLSPGRRLSFRLALVIRLPARTTNASGPGQSWRGAGNGVLKHLPAPLDRFLPTSCFLCGTRSA